MKKQQLRREINTGGVMSALSCLETPKTVKDIVRLLAEFIDNSIDAGANQIYVGIDPLGFLEIEDNGQGMSYSELIKLPNIAVSNKTKSIGRYGIGFKLAAATISEQYQVSSKGVSISGRSDSELFTVAGGSNLEGTDVRLWLKPNITKLVKANLQQIAKGLSVCYPNHVTNIQFNGKYLSEYKGSFGNWKELGVFIFQNKLVCMVSHCLEDKEVGYVGREWAGTYLVYRIPGETPKYRALSYGSSIYLEELKNRNIDYTDLRVTILFDDSNTFKPSTNKDDLIVADNDPEATEFLHSLPEKIAEVYCKYKEAQAEELNNKKMDKALKYISKTITDFMRNNDLDLSKYGFSGSIYTKLDAEPKEKTDPEQERSPRSDKGGKRNIAIDAIKDNRGPNKRHFYVEIGGEKQNRVRLIINVDHNATQNFLKSDATLSNAVAGWIPEIITQITFNGKSVEMDEYLDRHSEILSLVESTKKK